MRLLIVLVSLATVAVAEIYEDRQYYQYHGPPAPLTDDGMVMDTPEVARARAAHLAMRAAMVDRLRKAQDDYEMYEKKEMSYMSPPMIDDPMMPKQQRQRLLDASAREGRMMDSPEMTEPKNSYSTTHARAASKASEFYEFDVYDGQKNLIYVSPVHLAYKHTPLGYRGPFAPIGPDGRVVDTPEVMRARDAHMKAHARALAMSTQNDLYH